MAVNSLEIISIEYGYNPLALESPKQLWIVLKFPAPRDLKIGEKVRVYLGTNSKLNSVYEIEDKIGYRVSLNPLKLQIASKDAWSYDRQVNNAKFLRHNWHYGYGDTHSFLEYRSV